MCDPYPVGFQVLPLDLPDLGESSRERRTDLRYDVFGCQGVPDVFQRRRF